MNNASIENTVMIRKGNEYTAPIVVYVSIYEEELEVWRTYTINSDYAHPAKEEDLLPFDFKLFQRMYYQWHIDKLPELKNRYEELMSEYAE